MAYFENARGGRPGMHAAKVAALAAESGVSSRNTAEAFLREIVAYGIVTSRPDAGDLRIRWLVITPQSLQDVSAWAYGNLATLDTFDQGERAKTFLAAPQMLGLLQPTAARGFLASSDIRKPGATFALFDGVDEGGGIMDQLISRCQDDPDSNGRRLTSIAAIADFGDHLRISRSHLTRKLREAEAQQAMGWSDARGRSPIWISDAFVAQYIKRIAAELAAIELGYQAALSATA